MLDRLEMHVNTWYTAYHGKHGFHGIQDHAFQCISPSNGPVLGVHFGP